jgi:hypothetical protein
MTRVRSNDALALARAGFTLLASLVAVWVARRSCSSD